MKVKMAGLVPIGASGDPYLVHCAQPRTPGLEELRAPWGMMPTGRGHRRRSGAGWGSNRRPARNGRSQQSKGLHGDSERLRGAKRTSSSVFLHDKAPANGLCPSVRMAHFVGKRTDGEMQACPREESGVTRGAVTLLGLRQFSCPSLRVVSSESLELDP